MAGKVITREHAADGRGGAVRRRRVRPAAPARRRPRRPPRSRSASARSTAPPSAALLRRNEGVTMSIGVASLRDRRRRQRRPARRARRRGALQRQGRRAATAIVSLRAAGAPTVAAIDDPRRSPPRTRCRGRRRRSRTAISIARATALPRSASSSPALRRASALGFPAPASESIETHLLRRVAAALLVARGGANCREALRTGVEEQLVAAGADQVLWRSSVSARLIVSRAAPTAWASCWCVMCRTTRPRWCAAAPSG